MSEYTGKRIVPKHCGVWNSANKYEVLSIVLYAKSGDSYMARKEVPAGVDITDTEYWAFCADYSAQLSQIAADVDALDTSLAALKNQVAANVTASTDADADYAAEVIDARVDADAKTYASLGEALRGVDSKKANKTYGYGLPYSYSGWVNINTTDHTVEFPGNFIFFRSGYTHVLLESPDPVEYSTTATLVYICYSIGENKLVTHEWSAGVSTDEIVLFIVRPSLPKQSSGLFPFTVDSMQPFGTGTVSGTAIKDGTLAYSKLNTDAQEAIDAKVSVVDKKVDVKAEKTYAYGFPYSYRGPININTTDHQIEFPGNFIYFYSGGGYKLLSSPDPVEYSSTATLVYLCYNISSGTFTTHNWSSGTDSDEVILFILCPGAPYQSYGLLPFTVDSLQPFKSGTVDGTAIKNGTITGAKIAEETLDGSTVLADGSVTAEKLNDAILLPATSTLLSYTYSGFNKNNFEEQEDGSWHVYYTYGDDETAAWSGPGFTVARDFDRDLHIKMTYESSVSLTFYVVGNVFVSFGNIAATDGGAVTVELTVPYETLNEKGNTSSPMHVCFTTNKDYDFVLYSLEASYYDFEGGTFIGDYEAFKEEVAALEESVDDLSDTVSEEVGDYKGKKILFMGDSITALGTGTRGWLKYFNEIIEPESFVNTAVASARWCDYSDTEYDGNPVFNGDDANHNNTMGNQVEKLLRGVDEDNENYSYVEDYADFDMILIACGTNDGVPTADIESAFTSNSEVVDLATLDRTVFANAFRYVIENLQTMYPDAQIFICTPIQGYITTRSYSTTKARGDYLKLLAGRMSVEVIDTFECGVCDIYEEKSANGRYLIDGLHPNVAGAQVMGEYNARAVISKYRR